MFTPITRAGYTRAQLLDRSNALARVGFDSDPALDAWLDGQFAELRAIQWDWELVAAGYTGLGGQAGPLPHNVVRLHGRRRAARKARTCSAACQHSHAPITACRCSCRGANHGKAA